MLQNVRITPRLLAGFGAVLALTGTGAGVGLWQLSHLESIVSQVANEEATKLATAERWLRGISVNLVRARTSLQVTDEPELVAELKRDMDATSSEISTHEKAIGGMVAAGRGREIFDRISALRETYRSLRAGLLERRGRGEDVRAALTGQMKPAADAYLAAVQEFVAWQQGELEAAQQRAQQASRTGRLLVAGTTAFGMALGVVVALLVAGSIVAPLRNARDTARRIAGGDLHGQVTITGRDESAEMLAAVADMQKGLRRIVEEVHSGSGSVTTAAAEIAAGNLDLSARTEEQAASIEETAASIEELTSTVNQNAQNAREADALASSAAEVAGRSGKVVHDVVETMNRIQASSRRISDIIGVIDGIAFQTNILALNAAVEAARAGEQGRGFAVVASEVRSLAQRSAAAAREIKQLITESVETVEAGSRLAGEAGSTMEEVVASVQRVSEVIGAIATSTAEQTQGIVQVNKAVTELDRVTQQNAALVEESAAASESLKRQAVRLSESVAAFRLDDGTGAKANYAETPTSSAAPPQRSRSSSRALATVPKGRLAYDESWKEF